MKRVRPQSERGYSTSFRHLELQMGAQSSLRIHLNRPQIHNAFNEELIQEMTVAFKNVSESHPTARSVVLTGNGPSFSAGADLNWMKKMAAYTQEDNEKDSHQLFDMFHAIKKCPVPVIARVNGHAFGGGSGIIAACDIALAMSSAQFGFTEVKLGLIPAVISPFVMEKIGKSNCSRYFLTGEKFSADEARRIGLVSAVYTSPELLDEAVDNVVKEISLAGPNAVRICKDLISNVSHMSLDEPSTKNFVAKEIAKARVSVEGQEGLGSFLNKTKPGWITKK